MDGGEQSERGSAELGWGELGDGGAFGGFGAADPDSGEDEAAGEDGDAFAAGGESGVGEGEAAGAGGEDF